jgi:mono/diheme cytochrome c family protein
VHVRSILTGILPLLLGGVLVNACDNKEQPKADDKKTVAKADEKKADEVKADEAKADEAKADEAKADDIKADDIKAADDAAAADDASPDAADDGKVADDAGEPAADDGEPADDEKADDEKADDEKADDEKADDKKADAKKADDKKADDKAEPAATKIDAKGLFGKKCASCHGSSGKADTKLGEKHKIANWTEPGWKAKWSLAKVEGIVTNGKADTKMKPFKDKLTPEELKAVSKYAHGLGK